MPKIQPEIISGAAATPLKALSDFSLMNGGLLYRFWRSTRLSGDALEFARRRMLATVLVTWVPLLLLSIAEGNAWGRGGMVTFLQDVETHARLLIAAPLLILAEVRVHRVLPQIVGLFLERGLIPDDARAQFDAAIASALRLRNSVVAELLLIVFVYSVGIPFVWRDQLALGVTSWFATVEGGRLQPSLAGWWVALVSLPVLQFLVVRWYFRFVIWARFLWQVSRIELNLEPTHPDGTAGLHFLARAGRAYYLVLLGLGTVLAGMMANRIFYEGAKLLEFKAEIVGTVGLLVFAVLGPLLVFTPHLRVARRKGMEEYGSLGQQYAREFNRKWIRGDRPPDETPLGSADIQSLADLRNGYLVVEGIRLTPFGMKNVTSLAVITLLPVAPLLLTTFSVEQLLDRVLKVLL
ncbi:MAG: hypothetical protein WCE38_22395 [Burkholderiales bacterium]